MTIFNETVSDSLSLGESALGPASSVPRQVIPATRERWASQLIYYLKTNRPTIVDWYRISFHDVIDLETGQKTTELEKVRIKRAVVLPMSLERKSWNLAQIPEFQRKGLVEAEVTTVLIDSQDLPLRWVPPTTEDWFVFDNSRWDIMLSTNYSNRLYVVICAETVGQQMVRLEEAHSGFVLGETLTGVL